MKCVVIIYHANVSKIYKKEWIDKCIDSIKNQTHQDFDVLELNYGNCHKRYAEHIGKYNSFISQTMENHIHAMNSLIKTSLNMGYDIIFNVNLDDYYSPIRFEKQIRAIQNGAQLVSSNFVYFNDEIGQFKTMNMVRFANIGVQLRRNHNILAHPVIAYHKSFFDGGLTYNDMLGHEDLDLWKRAYTIGKRMVILVESLLFYRIHDNQITKKYKS